MSVKPKSWLRATSWLGANDVSVCWNVIRRRWWTLFGLLMKSCSTLHCQPTPKTTVCMLHSELRRKTFHPAVCCAPVQHTASHWWYQSTYLRLVVPVCTLLIQIQRSMASITVINCWCEVCCQKCDSFPSSSCFSRMELRFTEHKKLWTCSVERRRTSSLQVCGRPTAQTSIPWIIKSGGSCRNAFTRQRVKDVEELWQRIVLQWDRLDQFVGGRRSYQAVACSSARLRRCSWWTLWVWTINTWTLRTFVRYICLNVLPFDKCGITPALFSHNFVVLFHKVG